MEIKKARPGDLPLVGEIVRGTIAAVFPHYYPRSVVDFFLKWHGDENILRDIEAGEVYLLWDGPAAAGTVTLHGQELDRLFVPPRFQGKGYGRALLEFGERAIGLRYGKITLDASLPGKALYLKRGYRLIDYKTERQENGDVLCWDVLEKDWARPLSPPET